MVHKTHLFLCAEIAHLVAQVLLKEVNVLTAHGDYRVLHQNNTQRNGGIILLIVAGFGNRYIDKYKGVSVLKFDTRTLLIIQSGDKVGVVDTVVVNNILVFLGVR